MSDYQKNNNKRQKRQIKLLGNHNRGQIQQQFGAWYKLGADVDYRIITVSHGSRASVVKTLGYSYHMDPRAVNQ